MSKLAYKAFMQRPAEMKEYLHRFYYDKRSPIDLTNVPTPSVAPLDQKGSAEGNMLWISFGYGIQVSPLHTLTLYNAVANKGTMMKPYLVSNIQRGGVITKQFEPTIIKENICKPFVIKGAQESMEMVITEGTGRKAFEGMPFAVAGKTGTSHVADGKIKYDDGIYQASFVGYFPAENPQYTCIVVIRTKPHVASHFGGTVAAPVFRDIATRLYALDIRNVDPSKYVFKKDSATSVYAGNTVDIKNIFFHMNMGYADSSALNNWGNVVATNIKTLISSNPINNKSMPNVKGMGLKDALYLLENMGVKVSIKGKGKVVTQSVLPGTGLAKGINILLELS
jgi:cell division protein FtsI (penicillin-binding protein 3)